MHRRKRTAVWPLMCGVILIATVLIAVLTRWQGIVGGHPAYLFLIVFTALLSLFCFVLARRSLLRPEPAVAADTTEGDDVATPPRRPRRWLVWLRRALALAATLIWCGAILWLRPYSATAHAINMTHSTKTVRVATTRSRITLWPRSGKPTTGLVFYPGALVDPRAYVPLLKPLADDGYGVVIIKEPLSIAFLASGSTAYAMGEHPSVKHWVTSGHSLGGTVASLDVQNMTRHPDAQSKRLAGLLLWASYPGSSIADAKGIRVLSISASNDGLATPAKIDAHKKYLPPATEYVVIEGAVHSFFGDYGPQAGDGTPTIPRREAQHEIVERSAAFMYAVNTAGQKVAFPGT